MDDKYVLSCSDVSLDTLLLSNLAQSANLRKQVAHLLCEWVEAEATARLVEKVRELRRQGFLLPDTDALGVEGVEGIVPRIGGTSGSGVQEAQAG